MSSLVCSMTPARRSTGARATPARGRTAPPDSARRAAARSVTARPPARHRQPCRRGPAALGPARAVAVADPITGLIVTAVILRITWQSFNTVRSHPGEPAGLPRDEERLGDPSDHEHASEHGHARPLRVAGCARALSGSSPLSGSRRRRPAPTRHATHAPNRLGCGRPIQNSAEGRVESARIRASREPTDPVARMREGGVRGLRLGSAATIPRAPRSGSGGWRGRGRPGRSVASLLVADRRSRAGSTCARRSARR